jgi:hypothetical protein
LASPLVAVIFLVVRPDFRSTRSVSLNIAKRIVFVTGQGKHSQSNWPPNIGLQVKLDESTGGQWVTTLYLATVCIWSTKTKNAEKGREKIKPFLEALQKIAALKPSKLGYFDLPIEELFYL